MISQLETVDNISSLYYVSVSGLKRIFIGIKGNFCVGIQTKWKVPYLFPNVALDNWEF